MKLFFNGLLTLVLVQGQLFNANTDLQICKAVGGLFGKPFDDSESISAGQTLTAVKLCSNLRLDGIGVSIISPNNEKKDLFHGSAKKCQDIVLAPNEHITTVIIRDLAHYPGKTTRIGHITLVAKDGKIHEAGKVPELEEIVNNCTAPPGFQLGGFFGRSGDEIDALGVVWAPI